jgi:hypothetical protein
MEPETKISESPTSSAPAISVSTSTQDSGQRRKPAVFVIAVVLAIAIIFVLLLVYWSAPVKPTKLVSNAPSSTGVMNQKPAPAAFVPTAENSLATFKQNSKLTFPEASGQTADSYANLPADIKTLLGQNIAGASVKKLNYQNGKIGFTVGYSLNTSLEDSYNQLFTNLQTLPTGKWTVLYSVRGIPAALHQLQSSQYQLQVILTQVDATHTAVQAQILVQ